MTNQGKCPLTGHDAEITNLSTIIGVQVDCPACGRYNIEEFAVADPALKDRQHVLAGVLRQNPPKPGGKLIVVTQANVSTLLDSAAVPEDPQGAIDLILMYVRREVTRYDAYMQWEPDNDYPIAFAHDANEFMYLLHEAVRRGYLELGSNTQVRLTPNGWSRVEETGGMRRDSSQAFVAMWFDSSLNSIWEQGFRPALEKLGYRPIRIDKEQFTGKIDDHIITEIRRSGLLVADFTGHRAAVYFEAGFAMGLGIPIIWTCRQDAIDDAAFDTRQYHHIVWKDAEDLQQRLIDRIEATLPGRVRHIAQG